LVPGEHKLVAEVGNVAKIKCTVNSCRYWDTDNICRAEEIMVTINEASGGAGAGRTEFGQLGAAKEVGTSHETQCKTFQPRRSQSEPQH
jgi:hypothetical protein